MYPNRRAGKKCIAIEERGKGFWNETPMKKAMQCEDQLALINTADCYRDPPGQAPTGSKASSRGVPVSPKRCDTFDRAVTF